QRQSVMRIERVAIVGPGRLGASLVRALLRAGVNVTGLTGRFDDRVKQRALEWNLEASVTTLGHVADDSELVFVTVPDAELAPVTEKLEVGPGQNVVHCSGALGVA